MVKRLSTKLIAALGGVALSLTAGAGIASADPLVDTTCTEFQVMEALKAQDRALADKFSKNPLAVSMLRRFLASDAAGRQQMVTDLSSSSWAQKYMGSIQSVAGVCNNF